MPEMSGKFKSNPTKTNNLISWYFSRGGGGKKILGGVKKISERFERHIQNIFPPLQNPFLRPWENHIYFQTAQYRNNKVKFLWR